MACSRIRIRIQILALSLPATRDMHCTGQMHLLDLVVDLGHAGEQDNVVDPAPARGGVSNLQVQSLVRTHDGEAAGALIACHHARCFLEHASLPSHSHCHDVAYDYTASSLRSIGCEPVDGSQVIRQTNPSEFLSLGRVFVRHDAEFQPADGRADGFLLGSGWARFAVEGGRRRHVHVHVYLLASPLTLPVAAAAAGAVVVFLVPLVRAVGVNGYLQCAGGPFVRRFGAVSKQVSH
mmetsp:Transcript_26003/g.48483  ORF Transcript_26003/g.48483 Transcript_26003/m.48483 type:complete len:236 (-) Transcript_26003:347-1054(-)